jgi:hypothetical protein
MAAASLPRPQTPEERTLYTTWLVEARQAYHNLITGTKARVFVDQNGERIEYDRATASGLAAWIATIENALDAGLAAYRRARPLRFTF